MIRKCIPAAAGLVALFLFGAAAPASAQVVEWRGSAYFTEFSPACEAAGFRAPWLVRVRYRPPGVGSNGPSHRISFFDDYFAFAFASFDGPIARNLTDVQGVGLGSFGFPYQARMRFDLHQPTRPNLTPQTPTVRVSGQINNFDDIQGCRAQFDATMLLRR